MVPGGRSGNSEALLRPVAGVAEIQVIGALADHIAQALALPTTARSVWLHPDTATHVVSRRQADADFVLSNLPRAILRPHFAGVELCDSRRVRLVHTVAARSHLHVALKLVLAAEAGSATDELWVSTAYRIGATSLTRLRNKSTLWRVEEL